MVCDSLGKLVAKNIVVVDKQMAQKFGASRFCVFLPSVEGLTGIDSIETTKLLTNNQKPDFVVAIDSLCANDVSRLGFTIQLSDAGISPGAGVGNKKEVLNQKTLGVPVLCLGVPLLISASSLCATQNGFYNHFTPKEIDFVVEKCASTIACALNKSIYPKQILSLYD